MIVSGRATWASVSPSTLPSQVLTGRTPLPQESVIAERYRVDRLLGAGGMGVVVAAEDLKTGGPVAIKFLLREEMKLPDGRERFVREARALLRLASEHVVRILDVGNLANGAPFIVMEYLEGEDLRARLAATGPRSVQTRNGATSAWVEAEMLIWSGSPLDSMRAAVLTVSPQTSYANLSWPMTPATSGPEDRPIRIAHVGAPAGAEARTHPRMSSRISSAASTASSACVPRGSGTPAAAI